MDWVGKLNMNLGGLNLELLIKNQSNPTNELRKLTSKWKKPKLILVRIARKESNRIRKY